MAQKTEAQLNKEKYGLTQRPAPTANDRGRSGSGDLRNGQIGQGSPALSGKNDYNSDEVEYEQNPTNNATQGDGSGERLAFSGRSDPGSRIDSDRDNNASNGEISNGQKDQTTSVVAADQHGNSGHDSDGITRESSDDSRLAEGGDDVAGESDAIDGKSTGGNPIFSTGEKSSDQQNQQFTPAEKSTGEKKKGRGRPKKQNSEKPFSPQYYEWRGDSGGWKLIYRPPLKNGKLGYEYVGFLNPQRWAFFRRFNDEQFITAVTKLFEKRKQGRSVRGGGLRLVG